MMPSTRLIGSPWRLSRSARMIGMPPATAASNSRSRPAASAAAYSSAPTLASSSLFAVTTGLPLASASRISSRAGSMPPIASTTRSMSGSDTTVWASRVSMPSASSTSRGADRLRTATPCDLEAQAGAALDGGRLRLDELHECSTHVPASENPDPYRLVVARHAEGGYGVRPCRRPPIPAGHRHHRPTTPPQPRLRCNSGDPSHPKCNANGPVTGSNQLTTRSWCSPTPATTASNR